MKLFGQKTVPAKESLDDIMEEQGGKDKKRDAKFLKDINKAAYMDSGLSLDERINRNLHYIDRGANRD